MKALILAFVMAMLVISGCAQKGEAVKNVTPKPPTSVNTTVNYTVNNTVNNTPNQTVNQSVIFKDDLDKALSDLDAIDR
ncbi:MAG: hypothetical protein U0R44_00845 [Candidatus Micrarchaeia archaeon]